MKISKNQIKRVVKDMRRALSLLELELEVRARQERRPARQKSPNAIRRSELVELVRGLGHPVTAEMVRREFGRRGKKPSIGTISVHIHSANGKGELVKLARGLYEAAPVLAEAAQ